MIKTPPPALDEFVENYRGSIRNKFISALNSGSTKFIFDGPSGTGKSFLAEAGAKSLGMSFEKLNLYALDNVDDSSVSSAMCSLIRNSAQSKSLFDSNKKLLYIEDIEKVLSVDPTILKKITDITGTIVIFESHNGEIFKAKNRSAVSSYEVVRFYKLNDRVTRDYVLRILSLNGLKPSSNLINSIIKNSHGSLNNILTDIVTISFLDGKETYLPPRTAEDSIFEQLGAVFSGNVSNINTHFSSDTEAKNFEVWIADKAPQIYSGEKLYQVFDKLSSVDILLSKIKKQYWWLLKYVQSQLFSGVAAISPSRTASITYYAPNWSLYYKI